MRANPGGILATNEIIGRDRLIEDVWRVLDGQSVVLTSERRIGKTSVVRKMVAESVGECACVYRDVEGIETPTEFVQAIYEDAKQYLTTSKRTALGFHQLLAKLGGVEIADVKLPHITIHWKPLLIALIADLCVDGRPVVFFWDELPLFLQKLATRINDVAAMEVLDVLRSLRQTYPSLRMVFTGSVGLHHVVRSLRKQKYSNSPTNDMRLIEVPPLCFDDATLLARLLIEGEGLSCDPGAETIAKAIADAVGRVPFYVHMVIAGLTSAHSPVTTASVESYVSELITSPLDPADFRNYRYRLSTYYEGHERDIAFAVLDCIADSTQSLTTRALVPLLRHKGIDAAEGPTREVVDSLERDHYVIRHPQFGTYAFRYELVRKWWSFDRL